MAGCAYSRPRRPSECEKDVPVAFVDDDFTRCHTFVRTLGAGAEGVAELWANQKTGTQVVAKILISPEEIEGFPDEVYYYKCAPKMSWIVRTLGFYPNITEHHSRLVLEYCSLGSLDDLKTRLAHAGMHVPEALAIHFLWQIIHVVAALQTGYGSDGRFTPMSHGDLYYKNVLVHIPSTVALPDIKLADFGRAKIPDTTPCTDLFEQYLEQDRAFVGDIMYDLCFGKSLLDGPEEEALIHQAMEEDQDWFKVNDYHNRRWHTETTRIARSTAYSESFKQLVSTLHELQYLDPSDIPGETEWFEFAMAETAKLRVSDAELRRVWLQVEEALQKMAP